MTNRRRQTGEPLATELHRVSARPPSPLQVLGIIEGSNPDLSVVFHDTRDGEGNGTALVGVGNVLKSHSSDTLEQGLSEVRNRLEEAADTPCDIPLFFHLGFQPDAVVKNWETFDLRSVTCPRVVFRWVPGERGLRVSWLRGSNSENDAGLDNRDSVKELVARARGLEGGSPPTGGHLDVTWPGVERYRHAVAKAIEASDGASALQKVVVARSGVATCSRSYSATSVLASLNREYGTARLFAVAPSGLTGSVFLGASPERLIQSEGNEVRTMALAGTREREPGRDPGVLADELMARTKDRSEHGYVTRMIRDSLQKLGARVDVDDTPKPMVLANVIHLETPIRARFEASHPPNLGRLVEALHPTPAVCGTPTGEAMKFIREHEGLERGLYTGALGWQTADGGGDTTVALRCGLLEGHRARIYAGGGVTAGSDVDEEFEETSAKFEPMLQALRRAGDRT